MIHSMSGGVLSDGELHTFVKADGEAAGWYLCPVPVKAGDRLLLPLGTGTCEGTAVKVERCTAQTAPISPRRAREVLRVLG